MNKAIAQLLPALAMTTPSELREVLAPIGQRLGKDDWSGLLYEIEEVAQSGHTGLAEQLMGVCLQVAQENENGWAVRAVTYFLGHMYYLQGQVERAIEAYRAVGRSGQETADEDGHFQASLALSGIGRAYMAQGYISQAITAMEQALALDEQAGRQTGAIGSRLSLAGMYLVQEEFATAEKLLRDALVQARAEGHLILAAVALSNLAALQEDLNNPAAAIGYYEAALNELDAVVEPEDEELYLMTYRETLVGLGMAYHATSKPESAIAAYADAARLAYILEDRRSQAIAITWLGTAQLDVGRPNLALRSFRVAERLSRLAGDAWWLGTNCFFTAPAWEAVGEWEKAETAVYQAIQYHAATPGEHSADEAGCLVKLGEIALARGAFETAVDRYHQALVVLDRVQIGQMHRLIYLRLGEAYWYQGKFSEAYEELRQALDVYESKRQTVSELWARVEFAPSRDLVYEYLVRTCLALGRVGEAFTAVEEGRMRVFREQLASRLITDEPVEVPNWSDTKQLLSLK